MKQKKLSRNFFWALFGMYVLLVLVLCLTRINLLFARHLPHLFLGIPFDKNAHFVMFLPFAPLLWLCMPMIKKFWHFVLLFLAGSAFACLTEYAQSAITTFRNGDPYDFLADCIAILVGCGIAAFLKHVTQLDV